MIKEQDTSAWLEVISPRCPFCCSAVLTTGDAGTRHEGHPSPLFLLLSTGGAGVGCKRVVQGHHTSLIFLLSCGADHWRCRSKTQACGLGHCPFCCPAVLTTGNAGVGRKLVVQGHHTSLSFLLSCDTDHWRCRSKTQACNSGHCPFCCSAVLTTGDAGARHRRVVHAQHSSLSFLLSSCADHWRCRSKTQVRG